MTIDAGGIWSADIISVLIYPAIGALSFQLTHVLLLITFGTEAQVYCIFRLAIRLMSDLEAFTCSAGEGIRVDYVFAA